MPEVPKIQKKLCEAKFFLNHMMQSAGSTRLDHEHLEFYLSAFLSAARSVTDFFEKRNQKAWWGQWRANRSPDDLQLLNQMTKQRDNEVHEDGADVAHRIEDVPLSKIETPSALHAAYAPSFGEPWGEVQVLEGVLLHAWREDRKRNRDLPAVRRLTRMRRGRI